MFRRIIASVLVLAVLGYGAAWAFSGHALELPDHLADGVHIDEQSAFEGGGCDHCCHAAAHMVGMAPQIPPIRRPDTDSLRVVFGRAFATFASAPPLKPPRA